MWEWEILFAPFIVPFALFAQIGFWWYMGIVVLFVISQVMVYNDNRRGYEEDWCGWPIFFLLVVFFLANALTVGETTGWWDWFLKVVGHSTTALLHYLLYGLIPVIPLWMLHARVQYERLDDALVDFMDRIGKATEERVVFGGRQTLHLPMGDVEEIRSVAGAYKRGDEVPDRLLTLWQEYRDPKLLKALDPMQNKWRFASYVILWPFHVIDKMLGEVLYRVVRWFASRLADLALHFTKYMKYGMPDNIDK